MNWFDLLTIGTWSVGFIVGWRIGLFGAIFATSGLLFGVLLAGRFSDNISDLMTESISSDTLATVISYMVIICAVFIGFQMLRRLVKDMMKMVFLGWVDTLGSIALGLTMGLLLSGALITVSARYSNDLPDVLLDLTSGHLISELPLESLIERSGLQEKLHSSLVDSKIVKGFIGVRSGIPADTLGFIPDDFEVALDILEAELSKP